MSKIMAELIYVLVINISIAVIKQQVFFAFKKSAVIQIILKECAMKIYVNE